MNGHIMLSNGEYFDLMKPDMDLVTVEVIADSLSKLCRFTGHSSKFYSVAEHCVLVSHLVRGGLELEGLMHDASEAFVGDMATPLKNLQPAYRRVEKKIEKAIEWSFFWGEWSDEDRAAVKTADLKALAYEIRALMPKGSDPQFWNPLPPVEGPPPWRLGKPWQHARSLFIERYTELTEGR